MTHSRWFNQPSSSVLRTPESTLGGFPASWSLRGSFMAGQQCVFDRGGGTQIPPSRDHEEQASPKVATSLLPLRFIRSGSPICCTKLTQRFGSCPPAAPSRSVMILPEPPVDNSAGQRRGSEKGGLHNGREFIGGRARPPASSLRLEQGSSMEYQSKRWGVDEDTSPALSTETGQVHVPTDAGTRRPAALPPTTSP